MSGISILADTQTCSKGTHALVDPPSKTVVMEEDVAQVRGLRGYQNHQSAGHQVNVRFGPYIYGTICEGLFIESQSSEGKRFLARRLRVRAEDRKVAQVSISHDGDYAMAICMAVDEPSALMDEQLPVVDNGAADSKHEPEWGDEGWLTH